VITDSSVVHLTTLSVNSLYIASDEKMIGEWWIVKVSEECDRGQVKVVERDSVKPQEISVRIFGVPVEVRTDYLWNIKSRAVPLRQPARDWLLVDAENGSNTLHAAAMLLLPVPWGRNGWSYCHHLWVATDGVWIGYWIYWPLIHSTRHYKHLQRYRWSKHFTNHYSTL
jgi:hypothetical protein